MGFKYKDEYMEAVAAYAEQAEVGERVRWWGNVGSTAALLAVTIATLHYLAVPAWLAISIIIAVATVCLVGSITAGSSVIKVAIAMLMTTVEWIGEHKRD